MMKCGETSTQGIVHVSLLICHVGQLGLANSLFAEASLARA